jgi:DNA-binding response OmpR family regulator
MIAVEHPAGTATRRQEGLVQRIGMLVARPAAWHVLRAALVDANYSVAVARADPEPLETLLDQHDPDVLLIELGSSLLLLQYLRNCLRRQQGCKPRAVVALVLPEHLSPPHFVVGVDEFVLPPYLPEEILARLHLVLWRARQVDLQQMVRLADLVVNLAHREVRLGDRAIPFSRREFDLLAFLATHAGRTFSRDALLRHVWGHAYDGTDRVVDAYVRRLRRKLGHPYGEAIATVRGHGYRLDLSSLPTRMPDSLPASATG